MFFKSLQKLLLVLLVALVCTTVQAQGCDSNDSKKYIDLSINERIELPLPSDSTEVSFVEIYNVNSKHNLKLKYNKVEKKYEIEKPNNKTEYKDDLNLLERFNIDVDEYSKSLFLNLAFTRELHYFQQVTEGTDGIFTDINNTDLDITIDSDGKQVKCRVTLSSQSRYIPNAGLTIFLEKKFSTNEPNLDLARILSNILEPELLFKARLGSYKEQSVIPDEVESERFKFAVAVIDFRYLSTREALNNLRSIIELSELKVDDFTISPEIDYSVSMSGAHWTSPPCDNLHELILGNNDNWKPQDWQSVDIQDILAFSRINEAQQRGFTGSDISIIVLDTGFFPYDVYDCDMPDLKAIKDLHGTHIARILSSIVDNSSVISTRTGLCSELGQCSNFEIVGRILEIASEQLSVKDRKVIVNMSFGGGFDPQNTTDSVLYETLERYASFYSERLLIVASAGNHGLDKSNRMENSFPASFASDVTLNEPYDTYDIDQLENIIAVGTIGKEKKTLDETAEWKSVNINPVDKNGNALANLLAPGVNICYGLDDEDNVVDNQLNNCEPYGDQFLGLTGSSYATAIASGVAALTWSQCIQEEGKGFSAPRLKTLLLEKALVGAEKNFLTPSVDQLKFLSATPNINCKAEKVFFCDLENRDNLSIEESMDPGLALAIREQLGLNEEIACHHIADLTGLDASNRGITSLWGLQFGFNLTGLDLRDNEIESLEPLEWIKAAAEESKMIPTSKLENLSLHRNNISSIEPLRDIDSIKRLLLQGNKVEDISPLRGHAGLVVFDIRDNRTIIENGTIEHLTTSASNMRDLYIHNAILTLDDINILKAFSGLKKLDLVQSNISQDPNGIDLFKEFEHMSFKTSLENLNLYNSSNLADTANTINDLTPISGYSNLEGLTFSANNVEHLDPLINLTKLKELWMIGNSIESIEPLSNLTNLELLWLDGNRIVDAEPLRNLTKLNDLKFSSNCVENLDFLTGVDEIPNTDDDLINIQRLWAYGNRIEKIDGISVIVKLGTEPFFNSEERPALVLAYNRIKNLQPIIDNKWVGGIRVDNNTDDFYMSIYGNLLETTDTTLGGISVTAIEDLENHGFNFVGGIANSETTHLNDCHSE